MNCHSLNLARLFIYLRQNNGWHNFCNKNQDGQLYRIHVNRTVSTSSPPVGICLMKAEHQTDVVSMITNSFFRDEPLSKRLSFDLPKEPAAFINQSFELAVRDKCSCVAIDRQRGTLVGALINMIESEHDKKNTLNVSEFKSEKLRYIMKLLDDSHGHINLYKAFNTDRLLHLFMASVDGRYRGINLGASMVLHSLGLAKSYGIKGAFGETTGFYSSKFMNEMGFQVYNEIIYADYDSKRLSNLGIHDRCQFVAKLL